MAMEESLSLPENDAQTALLDESFAPAARPGAPGGAYVVLARKYRPKSFAQMVGQAHVVQALTHALHTRRLHHAYLFTGTRGIGKTTVSRILAKSLNCTGPDGRGGITAQPCGQCQACKEIDADRYIDYIELDAASNRSIDEVRDLIERAAYKPGLGRYKVFMIDEAHQLTKDAFNALLKTLEEPPEYLKFVLATTDPDKMLPTVLSRCLQFNLRPMAPATVQSHLATVLGAEKIAFDEGALRLLGRAARGSMRDALSLTDQAIAYGGGSLQEAVVRTMLGAVERARAGELVQALAARDGAALLAHIDALRQKGQSASGTLDELAELLQSAAIEQAVPGALDAQDAEAQEAAAAAQALSPDELHLLYSMALRGREDLALLGSMGDEHAALAMVLLRFLAFPSSGRSADASAVREPRRALLRAPAPACVSVAPAAVQAPKPAAVLDSTASIAPPQPPVQVAVGIAPNVQTAEALESDELSNRWESTVRGLIQAQAVTALVRELAWASSLIAIDTKTEPPTWRLMVESETLRQAHLREKLCAALVQQEGGQTLHLQVEILAGVPQGSPAKREAARQAQRQQEAEQTMGADPVVRELISRYPGARLLPGSVKPA